MSSWVVDVIVTFAIALVSANGFLRLRCRGVGPPFGPSARFGAVIIIVVTAILSTGLGVAVVVASRNIGATYVGLIAPSVLWVSNTITPPNRRRSSLVPRSLANSLASPLGRLYDRMGIDMQNWCDVRLAVAAEKPQWLSDAATYYYDQVSPRLKDGKVRDELRELRESIEHKIRVARLIGADTSPAYLQAELQSHPSTRDLRNYDPEDPPLVARRLTSDATSDLRLLLIRVYQLGYHKLLIYPVRAPDPRRVVLRSVDPA
jgi:hypothetical protein